MQNICWLAKAIHIRKQKRKQLQAHFKPVHLKLKASKITWRGGEEEGQRDGKSQLFVEHMLTKAKTSMKQYYGGLYVTSVSSGILWHLWFINSFSNEYFKT